jgi:hypothetical protein
MPTNGKEQSWAPTLKSHTEWRGNNESGEVSAISEMPHLSCLDFSAFWGMDLLEVEIDTVS